MSALRSILVVIGLLAPSVAAGADFYVDPVNGSDGGDGSSAAPWRTLEQVVISDLIESENWATLPYQPGGGTITKNPGAPVKAGDTIWLRSGYHGALNVSGAYNDPPITIAAEPGQSPELERINFTSAGGWVVRGVSVSPSHAPAYSTETIVSIANNGYSGPSFDVVVEDSTIFSVPDISGWSDVDWNDLAANGISVRGDRVTIRGNVVRNIDFGISVDGANAMIDSNLVENFSGDGLRGLGDGDVFQYNVVRNSYAVNANHDDGFQSWSVGTGGVGTGEVTGIVLRGNTFINYTDPSQPYRATLQGIGCFDGFFVNWIVENNVVITDHWHGITFLGMRDSRIVNNTVIDINTTSPGPPWIMVGPHKDGTASSNVIVRNNLATDFDLSGTNIVDDANLLVTDLTQHFVNASAFDLHLIATSGAIDVGSADQAPAEDIEGIPRPQGLGVDLGAYEWRDPATIPDAGPADASAPDSSVTDANSVDGGQADAGESQDGSVTPTDAGTAPTDAGNAQDSSSEVPDAGSAAPDGGVSSADAFESRPSSDAAPSGGCGCSQAGPAEPNAWLGWWLVLAIAVPLRRTFRP